MKIGYWISQIQKVYQRIFQKFKTIEEASGSKSWWEYNKLIYSTDMGEENSILKKAWESDNREEFNMVKALIS